MYVLIYSQSFYSQSHLELRDAWDAVQTAQVRDAPTHVVQINEDGDARVMDLPSFVRYARDCGY